MFRSKYVFIALLILLSGYQGSGQVTTISGVVSGKVAPAIKELQFYFNASTVKAAVDKETQTFSTEVKLDKAQFIEIKSGGSVSNFIYMLPGEKLVFNLEKRTLNENIIQIEEGNIRMINQVMERFYGTFSENGVSTLANRWVEELFIRPRLVEQAISNAMGLIHENEDFFSSTAPGFKNDFIFFTENFRKYCQVDNYSLDELKGILTDISKSDLQLSVLTVPFYRDFLVDLTNAYAARKLERYDLVLEYLTEGYKAQTIAAEACVEFIPNQGVINYLFYDKLNREMASNGIKHIRYVDYLLAHSGESVRNNFIKRYETLKANAGGESKAERIAALDFEFEDASGKVYHLADFRGKMLVIDFWASWCAPCKIQLPYFKELEKQYEGKDIVFAKVSLDNTKQAWLKGVESEGLTGIVLHASGAFKNPFPVHYGITSIPRFMLIDAEGKVITDNMPKPQNKEEVMALIDADLYRSEMRQIINKHLAALGADKLTENHVFTAKLRQSMMGIEVDHEVQYNYPKNFRMDTKPVYNPSIAASIGEDFFNPRYMLIQGDSVSGNISNMKTASASWMNRLPGFDLFIADKVFNIPLDFAEENFTNSDNQYVIKAAFSNRVEKYYIDKEDYLIKKMVQTSQVDPRKGGGRLDAPTRYNDYAKIDGVMVPHSYTLNNILNFKLVEAGFEPLNGRSFSNLLEDAK